MTIKGVSKSELYKRASEGDLTKVPIGQTILTNTPEQNSANVRLENEGQEIENLDYAMFDSFGYDTLQVGRKDGTSEITYRNRTVTNEGRIKEINFDKETGTLFVVKANKKLVTVSGFYTQKDFGVGPTGPKGNRGKDADDGNNGRNGKLGVTGCPGPVGPQGAPGAAGNDGADGDPGDEGPEGCEGTQGAQGPQGPAGVHGFEGSRGFRGDKCSSAEAGAAGTDGVALNTSVVIGTDAPDELSVLWGIPS